MLARRVRRPTLGSRKATVTSSSLRVSLEVTTIPSPKRSWRTRSPSRKRRSPGTSDRGAGPATAGAPARPLPARKAPPPAPMPRPGRPARARPPRAVQEVEVGLEIEIGLAVEPGPDGQRLGDLEEEAGRHAHPVGPPRRPPPGEGEEEASLRPGDPDVGEPPFLLQGRRIVEGPAVGEDPLLETGDEDDRELETLGGVEGDEGHPVLAGPIRVGVGDEGGVLEEAIERVLRGEIRVPFGHPPELEEVRPALGVLLRAVGEHRPIAGLLEDLVEELRQREDPDPGPQPAEEPGRTRRRPPRPAKRARSAPPRRRRGHRSSPPRRPPLPPPGGPPGSARRCGAAGRSGSARS
jgi:hypothetical protein